MRFGVICAAIMVVLMGNAARAEQQTWRFTWDGAGGYTVEGALAFDTALVSGPVVMVDDVQCFEITGLFDGAEVGRWALTMLTPDTTWRLHFVPAASGFVVEGTPIDMPQAWNMNGRGDNCGAGGFGLNIGNFAQDICLDNTLITDSQVSPFQPFPAQRDDSHRFSEDACRPSMLLGAIRSPAGAVAASR